MADLDLIPREYGRSQNLEARLRGFVIAAIAVAALVGIARLGIEFLISLENSAVTRLRAQGELSALQVAKAEDVRKQKLAAEKRLAELDQLRGSDRLKLLLRAIDSAYRDNLWLDEMRFFRRENLTTGTLGNTPGAANSGIIVVRKEDIPPPGTTIRPPDIEQQVELSGHALDHALLAEFMRAVGKQPGIVDVRLLDTGMRNYTSAVVIDFKLALSIDEKAGRAP